MYILYRMYGQIGNAARQIFPTQSDPPSSVPKVNIYTYLYNLYLFSHRYISSYIINDQIGNAA